ncbi:MAG: error-prone DNA polymerase [Bdellovibrio sp. CG10_big_fil_rev_8_21_14_0_10_47_8]|nr:MAG: error-prone DNA polymerase [Bdellovibrio sp. CG10_big_fil_rev_8_21_14_0_10_47_8]
MKLLVPGASYLPRKKPFEGSQDVSFVELLGRSNFSFLQGASHPEEMVEQALLLDYAGISICDLNGLYGVARGFKTATSPSFFASTVHVKEGFRYRIGTELHLTELISVALMPLNKRGYSRICELITQGKRGADKGFSKLSLQDLLPRSEDLLCFLIPPFSDEQFFELQKTFQDRLYLPIWRDLTWESRCFVQRAFELEEKYSAQLFVTNRPLMHIPERKPVFDVQTCLFHQITLNEAKDKLIQNAERYLKPLDELINLWRDRLDLLQVTVEIADRIEFQLDQIRYRYPNSNLPSGWTATDYLRHLTYEGLKHRYTDVLPEKVIQVTEHELKIVRELEYEDYFLTLYEICQFARSQGILYQGRGSAANSVICYAIGLTAVDPVQMDLLFERFISRERGEPPDIDIDFEHSRREEVIQHIYRKYGENHAAMVCTVIRFRSRMAFRETAKVFGIPLKTVNAIIKFMGRDGMRRLKETPEIFKRFAVDQKTWDLTMALATELHGFPRHLGIHTGGFLITQNPITEMIPVEKASMQGRYVIQWNKDDVNDLKLMKIDVLSLGMLTALRKCFDLLRNHKNMNYELATLPPEDPKTYDMICKADTVGVFQIESRAQMNTLPRLRPENFYDLVVEVALVRPGPLQGGMVHPYLKRRQGKEKTTYFHKDLEPILKKTLGVPIFQEQVMRIVVAVAGFSPGEADELRRIMSNSWRRKGTMEGVRERILKGMRQHGIEDKYAEQIYKTIEGFGNYGFPESHAASFALLTYASSYIKCHHPDVFACALLNSQPMGFYAPRVLIADAQRHGASFLPIDIQFSDYDYTLQGDSVRVGLRALSAIPEKLLQKIQTDRQEKGAFQNLTDFIHRLQLPKSVLTQLAAAGALCSFEKDARRLIWKIESLELQHQSFLWGQPREQFQDEESEDSDQIPFESKWEATEREYKTKGFALDSHPIQVLRSWLNERNVLYLQQRMVPFSSSSQLKNLPHQRKIRLAGLISVTQRPPTAKGMCFITLEDEHGFMNIVIHPDVYQRDRMTIYNSSFLEVWGVIEKKGTLINIKALKLAPLLPSKIEFERLAPAESY